MYYMYTYSPLGEMGRWKNYNNSCKEITIFLCGFPHAIMCKEELHELTTKFTYQSVTGAVSLNGIEF